MSLFAGPSVAGGLLLLLLKVTLVMALALAADRLLRRAATAHVRHGMWTAAVAVSLVLPLVGPVLPPWPVASPSFVPDGWRPSVSDRVVPESATTYESTLPPGREPRRETPLAGRDRFSPEEGTSVLQETAFPSRAADILGLAAILVWLVGAGVAASRLALALIRERLLVRGSRAAAPTWRADGRRIARSLSIRRRIRLRESERIDLPMTGGTLRPTVLIPCRARRWSPGRRQIVLAHELIHIRRLDPLRQLAARALTCLFWFHPLVHLAARKAAVAREQACDEAVLAFGTRPSRYAGHLLAIAGDENRPIPCTVLAMAQASQLERRLTVILDPSRPTRTSLFATLIVGVVLFTGLTVAAAMPEPATPSAQTSPELRTGAQGVDPCRDELSGTFQGTYWRSSEDGWSEIVGIWDGDRLARFRLRDDLRLCFHARGDVEIPQEGELLLGPDSRARLETLEGSRTTRLELTRGGAGTSVRRFSVDGRERPFNDEARRWMTAALEVLATQQAIADLRSEVGSLRGRIGSIRGEEGSLRGMIGSIRGEMGSLRGQIGSIRGSLGSLRGQIGSLRGQIGSLRDEGRRADSTRRRGIEEEVEGLQLQIDELVARYETEAEEAQGRIAELRAQIAAIDRSRIAELEAQIEGLDTESRIRELVEQIEALDADSRIADLEAEIDGETDRLVAALRGLG